MDDSYSCYIKYFNCYLGLLYWRFFFLNNDRVSNPNFNFGVITDFARQNIFTNGFYITVTIIALIALLSFKLYRHYYYKLFAIATWIMLIGSLTLFSIVCLMGSQRLNAVGFIYLHLLLLD